MRVQLRSERGAIAVMVALTAVTLFGMAAFAVDAGMAYNTKRQLSIAADASSLAGAAALASYPGSCTTVSGNAAAVTAARNSADSYLTANRPSSTRTDFQVACSSDSKSVVVTYSDTGSVNSVFSRVFGIDSLSANRTATASIDVPPDAAGLRPYGICESDVTNLETGGIKQFNLPNAACGNAPGNWYTLDCPANGTNNSTVVLSDNTAAGCASDIYIIDTSAATLPAAKIAILTATCAAAEAAQGTKLTANPGCLTANTGNLASSNIEDSWRYLVGLADVNGNTLATPVNPRSIVLPVFYPGSVVGTGSGAVYPVYAFVGATVCGYHWQAKTGVSNRAVCAGAAFTGTGKFDALLLSKATVVLSGSSGSPTCALGAACDRGARRVRLVR